VQRQLKHTTLELLRVYLKGKHPLKRDAEISELLNKRVEGVVLEEEWVDIVKYMYAPEDATLLLVRIREIARAHHRDGGRGGPGGRGAAGARGRGGGVGAARGRGAPSRREAAAAAAPATVRAHLPYSSFVKALLDFQLAGHQQFLAPFLRLFRQVAADGGRSGVIDEAGFAALVRALDPAKPPAEVDRLLAQVTAAAQLSAQFGAQFSDAPPPSPRQVDPHDHKQMTFSDCVATLSSDLVRHLVEDGGAPAAAAE